MTLGIHTVNVANAILDWLRGVAPATIPGLFWKLHTGDPGSAGTANASAVTSRVSVTYSAASGGSMSFASAGGSFAMTATETITHISVWTASSGGNVLWTFILTASRSVVSGDTLTPNAGTLSNSPLMA